MILFGQLPFPQRSCHGLLNVGGEMDALGCMPPTENLATPPYGPCRTDKTKLVSLLSKKIGLYLSVTIPLGFRYSNLCKICNKKASAHQIINSCWPEVLQ